MQEQEITEQLNKTEKQSSETKPKRKGKFLSRMLGVISLLSIGGIGYLTTGYGQRSVIHLADRLLDTLSIEQIEGSLQEGLTLTNTQYKMAGFEVSAGLAQLHFDFSCLWKYDACLENLSLKEAKVVIDTIQLLPSQPQKDHKPFTEFNLPLGITAKNIALDNLNVKVDDLDIQLDHFQSGIQGKGRSVTLFPTELNGLAISLAPQSTNEPEQAIKSEAKSAKEPIDWAAIQQTLNSPFLDNIQPLALPLDFNIEQLKLANINISQKPLNQDKKPNQIFNLDQATLVAKANHQTVEIRYLDLKSKQGHLLGQGQLVLNGDYPLDFQLHAEGLQNFSSEIPVKSAEIALSGALFQKTALNVKTLGAIQAELEGNIALATENNPFNLSLKSQSLTYPFFPKKGEDPLKLNNIALNLQGDMRHYQLSLSGNAKGANIPATSVNLKGNGTITHFAIDDLNLTALDGKAQLSGLVDWRDGVEWQSKLQLNNINTKSLSPDWSSLLSGDLESKGYAARGEEHNEWAIDVPKMDIKGTLSQRTLQLQGQLKSDHQTLLNVPNATLIYGENRIAMQGVLGDNSNFTANLNAPNLQGLVPRLKAGIKGNITLLGKVSEPNLELDLTANNVAYDDLNLQHLTAKGKVTTEKNIQGDVAITLRKLTYGEIKVEKVDLNAKGSEAQHSLTFNAKGDPISANLQLSGKFDRLQQVWNGQINQLVIENQELGKFKTNQTVNVNYNNQQINAQVSPHCWLNSHAELCFPQTFNAGQDGNIPFEIKRLNLEIVKDYLDNSMKLSGILSAKGEAAWFKNRAPQVNLEVNSNSLKFTQILSEGRTFPITASPLKINARLADNNLNLKTDLQIENNGRLVTDLVIKDIIKLRTLSGKINIDQISLRLIKPLLMGGETVDGNINAKLTMSGNMLAPQLHGQLILHDLRAKSVSMPFDITDGHLAMNFLGTNSTLSGMIKTPESDLHLEGSADWRKLNAWRSTINARANRFKVSMPNIGKVEISPNISVSVTPKELELGGNIDIPWARIEVEELPESAVSVSDDEVIMDGSVKKKIPLAQRQIPQTTSSGMAIKSNINIHIGDDVNLNAYGLKANLDGTIAVRQGKQGLGLYGQVNLTKGRYASFGQDLIIRKGQISFAGLPSQPNLNIEAIRNPEAMEDSSIIAGVKVYGLADRPEVKVFSEPAMSQNDALSYVLTGRSLDSSGDGNANNSMAAAVIGLSLSKSSKLVGKVGNAFGLNDLNVTTAGIGDNTKVEVSASLTPKFRVKYGVGLFAPLTELTLRYNLAPKLYLQWVSSVNQAVDLMYRFDFD
ncbi:MAG: translocation/assembly module TamB [Haemophilus parahaemolyticus]|uniref:autotransporter assembly complex protein TamB n=1 Tax=Haemophilus parahaemolyticus TaxID=735 RepID=UPI0026ED1FF0|nr:translocation/assembly module TamB domain-containing protein [Haemophilus parahaemolyticus]MBS6009176.1 translocation/assembly module TamB [Haemophilus parahaemolyticus]